VAYKEVLDMPSLFKPKITAYRLPSGAARTRNGKLVTKKTPHAVRIVRQAKKWYGRYGDGNGKRMRVPLSENKEVARDMLAKLVNDARKARMGIRDPFAPHRERPLREHLEDFRSYLAAKGNVPEHVARTVHCCEAIMQACQFHYAADVQASVVVQYLADRRADRGSAILPTGQNLFTGREVAALLGIRPDSVRHMVRCGRLRCTGSGKARRFARADLEELLQTRQGFGIVTSNHYLAAIKHFSHWLVKDRRTESDPLAGLARQNAETDRRRPRRALREDLFLRLVEATGKGAAFRGITGPDRLVLYTLAANTGFRANELSSLTPTSFALDKSPATVTVEAGYSKHRRKDVQPLRADVADLMRQYIAGKPALKPLWPGTWAKVGAEMLRMDLDAAAIAYRDSLGRYFDFHAMRGQFISFLAAKGVHPKVAQVLARHSTIKLTMDYYTHLDVFDVAGALDKLPEITKTSPDSQAKESCRA
jgi:excisionase family DNA binding protein